VPSRPGRPDRCGAPRLVPVASPAPWPRPRAPPAAGSSEAGTGAWQVSGSEGGRRLARRCRPAERACDEAPETPTEPGRGGTKQGGARADAPVLRRGKPANRVALRRGRRAACGQYTPCASIASATLTNPLILAPST